MMLPSVAVFIVAILVLSERAFGDRRTEDVQFAARGLLGCFAGIFAGIVLVLLVPSTVTALIAALPAIAFVGFAWLLSNEAVLRGTAPPSLLAERRGN